MNDYGNSPFQLRYNQTVRPNNAPQYIVRSLTVSGVPRISTGSGIKTPNVS